MPQVGDILRAIITFELADGGLMQNVYTIALTQAAALDWDGVLGGVDQWFRDMYENYMDNVADEVQSTQTEILLRDDSSDEWNTVAQHPFTDLIGLSAFQTSPSLSCATVVAYPQTPRHWGFKNLPPVADVFVENGSLTAPVLADLLLFAGYYTDGRTGAALEFDSGVYSLATNTFRPFTPTIKLTDVIGSRVTRKEGRGI